MASATIFSGICGFTTEVHAKSGDNYDINVSIESTCPHIHNAAAEITILNALQEIDAKKSDRVLPKVFEKHCPHPACPVPAGIVKAIEVAAGLALPQDAIISLVND